MSLLTIFSTRISQNFCFTVNFYQNNYVNISFFIKWECSFQSSDLLLNHPRKWQNESSKTLSSQNVILPRRIKFHIEIYMLDAQSTSNCRNTNGSNSVSCLPWGRWRNTILSTETQLEESKEQTMREIWLHRGPDPRTQGTQAKRAWNHKRSKPSLLSKLSCSPLWIIQGSIKNLFSSLRKDKITTLVTE